MSDYAVRALAVAHRYGTQVALDGINLEFAKGCMAGVIGPDGAGKSTLLGLVAGAVKLQSGVLDVLGENIASGRSRVRVAPRIAYMSQGLGGNLYVSLSVRENLEFFAALFELRKKEYELRIRELLRATGLDAVSERSVATLSGGMKQKLGLCCALIHSPDLLVLDEPTTGVDALSRRRFWRLVSQLRSQNPGMSLLIATAYMEEARGFDWIAAMDGGRVLDLGSPSKIIARSGAPDLDSAFKYLLSEKATGPLVLPSREREPEDIVISARDLVMQFGNVLAVNHVNFSIQRGEIFGFLGSNGCGKTTTMKMLAGLLQPTHGQARLFGAIADARDLDLRTRVGYMSQSFSLYGELTVRQNLLLHARLFRLPSQRIDLRIEQLLKDFGLKQVENSIAGRLPLGMRQRLSLAVAVVHEPEILILDEPTSGVDPLARDRFWGYLIKLSREQNVTIFMSTHFMSEGERCDRVSLMHEGQVLACGTPAELTQSDDDKSLEDIFIALLEGKNETTAGRDQSLPFTAASRRTFRARRFSWRRLFAYTRREVLELRRDPIRLTFALVGSVLLMLILGYGITMDVTTLKFAVLDQDHSPQSREYVANLAGSKYFSEQAPLQSQADLDRRMQTGELSLALEIPSGFGRNLKRGRSASIGVWVDGSMPFRGETVRGYLSGIHYQYLLDQATRVQGIRKVSLTPTNLEFRYRYNQDFRSLDAMVPAVIPLLLIFVPSILMALGVVREKELGSITNLYVTPVTRTEFLVGKQLPYIALGMLSFFMLLAMATLIFEVPLKGSVTSLSLGALLYVTVTTGIGLLVSTFTRTQIAALAGTAILTLVPTIQFSGLTEPVSSLQGVGSVVGRLWPASYFLVISRGVFSKALTIADLREQYLLLALFVPTILGAAVFLLRKQAR